MKRRTFLAALAAPVVAAPAIIGLFPKSPRRIAGGFVDDGGALGHRLRDRRAMPAPRETRRVPIVIVGGGIAGLSAAWELDRRGVRDFVLLELESSAGGNSRWSENDITAYPWAAHYVPVPSVKATLVRELFEELGVLRNGVWEERHLCFSPQERLFLHGEWHEGFDPTYALGRTERDQFKRFDDLVAASRASGEFTIPMADGVKRASPLDRLSMAEWMRTQRLDGPAIQWLANYGCRDDYGAALEQTSAWAGIHYFASRGHEEQGPLTWPEGNGWIARRLIAKLKPNIETDAPVYRIERRGAGWQVLTPQVAYVAEQVIFAAPTLLVPHLVVDLGSQQVPLSYSPWLTANLTLERWPKERGRGVSPAWDNVIYNSPALGYVVATHQSLRTREERTVWTYYWSLSELSPANARRLLQARSWHDWTELILGDLARAHPDIRECVSRVDIMRMGHAMVRPTVGFLGATVDAAKLELPGLHLANSDLSGLSIFEEAQYRGVSAARRVMR